jgi:RNA polymerase sigma factor (TIGR02999 family)
LSTVHLSPVLGELREGGGEAVQRLFPLLYDELRQIARRELRRRSAGNTLDTTALLHESYLRLASKRTLEIESRSHFVAIASTVMRALIVDEIRRKAARKRGGDWNRTTLDVSAGAATASDGHVDLLALDDALRRLGEIAPRLVDLVEMRFFGGLSHPEAAEALGISEATAKREWGKARALLKRFLGAEACAEG